jgi:hypothetical protein
MRYECRAWLEEASPGEMDYFDKNDEIGSEVAYWVRSEKGHRLGSLEALVGPYGLTIEKWRAGQQIRPAPAGRVRYVGEFFMIWHDELWSIQGSSSYNNGDYGLIEMKIAQRSEARRKEFDLPDPVYGPMRAGRKTVDGPQRQAVPKDIKMFVWQRDQGKCVYCGDNRDLEFDHIIPVSMGGSNTARNLQLLCEPCNRSKGGKL